MATKGKDEIIKRCTYRLYPNKSQKVLLEKHFGCSRLIYNLALETKITAYESAGITLSKYDLCKQIKELREEFIWLKEVSSKSLRCSIYNMDNAFHNFFKGKGFPKFKSKKSKRSFTVEEDNVLCFDTMRFGTHKFRRENSIKFRGKKWRNGKVKSCTVYKSPTGKYYVSATIVSEIDKVKPAEINKDTAIGIDLGIKDFLIDNNGNKVNNPKFYRELEGRLKVLQRRASRKKKGSSNSKKAWLKVAKVHEKIKNKRSHWLHQLTNRLISENQGGTICMESLQVNKMLDKNRQLSKSISDASWGQFTRMLEYKCEWYGVNLLKCGRYDATSKTCSCGIKNDDLTLTDREWVCTSCGTLHDRDILAANNIIEFAFKNNREKNSQ